MKNKKLRKRYHDRRHRVKTHGIKCGDAVVIKRERKRKESTPYEPYVYIVTKVRGSTIHTRCANDGRIKCRDASKVKLLRTIQLSVSTEEPVVTNVPPTYQRRRDGGGDKRLEEVKDVQEQGSITMDELTMETEQFRPRRPTRNRKWVYVRRKI